MSTQITVRVDDGLLERADALIEAMTRTRGIEQTRVSVLREAMARGLIALAEEHGAAPPKKARRG